MPVLLDTRDFDGPDRAAALHSALTRATAAHELTLLGPADRTFARLEHWQLNPDVALLHQTSSGVSHTRTRRHARHDGPARVVFVLHSGGPGSYDHDGKRYGLRDGGLYVTDLNSCYSYTRPGYGTARIVQIERSALGLTMEQVRSATATLWTSPFHNLLRAHIAELCEIAPTITIADGARLAPVIAHLAGTLLATAAGTHGAAQAPTDYLVERTTVYLRANHHRPELAAAEIAHAHSVSTRYLFQQWATQPQTLNETLLGIRMTAAHELLATDASLPIAVVAHRCGFLSASAFSRTFRRTYGINPSQLRNAPVRDHSVPAPAPAYGSGTHM